MRAKVLTAVLTGIVLSASFHPALAGIVVDVDFVTRNFLPPDTGLPGFVGLQIDVESDDGALISAVDVSFEGPLHQRWGQPGGCGFTDDCTTPLGPPANGRGDSHLTPPSNRLFAAIQFEDNPGSGSPFSGISNRYYYGIGSTLASAWGIPGPHQSPRAPIAYLVIPNADSVQFHWAIATTGTTGETFVGTTFIFIPEPDAVAILLMLSLGLSTSRTGGLICHAC